MRTILIATVLTLAGAFSAQAAVPVAPTTSAATLQSNFAIPAGDKTVSTAFDARLKIDVDKLKIDTDKFKIRLDEDRDRRECKRREEWRRHHSRDRRDRRERRETVVEVN